MTINVLLLGNPNSGKTSLYNLLTKQDQHVANWAGVTADQYSAHVSHAGQDYCFIDLPGIYAVDSAHMAPPDAVLVYNTLTAGKFDVVLNIVAAHNLERQLYLSLQLLEMHIPVVLVVSMNDIAARYGKHVNLTKLAQILGCPVLIMPRHASDHGLIDKLYRTLASVQSTNITRPWSGMQYYDPGLLDIITKVATHYAPLPAGSVAHASTVLSYQYLALHYLEWGTNMPKMVQVANEQDLMALRHACRAAYSEDLDIIIADARYHFIQVICRSCVVSNAVNTLASRCNKMLDALALHRVWGVPVFLLIMYLMFTVTIGYGTIVQNFIMDHGERYISAGLAYANHLPHSSLWAVVPAVIASGVRGLLTTIAFTPILGGLFFGMTLLEHSGYMARAAFVIERFMQFFGLPGKAFLPLLIGFGCNVPAVMASRNLANMRERIITIMISPFMSCGARLAIYALFTAAFFPEHGALVVLVLYLIGILVALFTSMILRYTILAGATEPLLLELPEYHLPNLMLALRTAIKRTLVFIMRAGQYIIPLALLLSILQSFSFTGTLNDGSASFPSMIAVCGRWLTPIFAPMGIHEDNWPAVIGLLSGLSAKELVVGTLNTLYAHLPAPAALVPGATTPLTYGAMYTCFGDKIAAFSYLLLVLLYFPCVSTLVVMARELNYRWAVLAIFWSCWLAYIVAVAFYQLATMPQHIISSLVYIGSIIVMMTVIIYGMRRANA